MSPTSTSASGKQGRSAKQAVDEEEQATSVDEAGDPPAPDDDETGADAEADVADQKVTRRLDPDEREALEDQRDFLLQSLRDLEAEHEAGDVADDDFEALRDDYTARAARIIRALEASRVKVAGPHRREDRGRRRFQLVVAGIGAFAVLAGVLMWQATSDREAGDEATGDIRESSSDEVNATMQQAETLALDGRYDEAIALYDEVLAEEPDNYVALTLKGWFQYQSAEGVEDAVRGVVTLTQAVQINPDYPSTHAFLSIAFAQLGCPSFAESALAELDRLDAPAEMREMVPTPENLAAIDGSNCILPSTSTTPTG